MYDEFVEDYEPTKADSYRKKVEFCRTTWIELTNVLTFWYNVILFFLVGAIVFWLSAIA